MLGARRARQPRAPVARVRYKYERVAREFEQMGASFGPHEPLVLPLGVGRAPPARHASRPFEFPVVEFLFRALFVLALRKLLA